MRPVYFSLLAFLLSQANVALAFYGSRDAVVELTNKNFKQQVLDSDYLAAVEFYAPWCGHCQRLAPDWKKAAKNLEGLITVGAVNCDDDANKPLCGQYGIQGFPTIKVFRPEYRENKKTGTRSRVAPTDYQGPRDAKAIVDHLLSLQPSNVRYVKADPSKVKSKKSISFDDFLQIENATLPKALLFTDKPTTSALYKSLSVEFGPDRMLVGEVKKYEKDLVSLFGIQTFPTLYVISPEHGHVVYDGKQKREPLTEFLEAHALKATKGKGKQAKKETKSETTKPKVEPRQVVELANNDAFKKQCDGNALCVIAIVSEDEKEETLDMLEKLNTDASPRYRFAWTSAAKAAQMTQKLDLAQDLPTLFLVQPTKQVFRTYVGPWEAKGISNWLDQISTGRMQAWPYEGSLEITERLHDEL
ncbi:hypothetical protein BCR43DRAFT_483775 [Syncephalastrum racemosum]|uniref:protein disulfide-isomerase n=1 Tax=Syncephalastrum racemosum TaxID=13706 RepID=A0A1X2HVQ4_SYNRA|nr:hypothetical protein BCR43DRAFT_483775 [Syncephalastrum racemosum]